MDELSSGRSEDFVINYMTNKSLNKEVSYLMTSYNERKITSYEFLYYFRNNKRCYEICKIRESKFVHK